MTEATYKILACDGGGIFGVITAKLLQSLDRSVLDNIDLFAGTSTGIVNLMIAGERKSRRRIEVAVRRQLRHQ